MLLALIREKSEDFKNRAFENLPRSIASRVFENCGLRIDAARKEADLFDTKRTPVAVEIPFTPRCKRLLERSWVVAKELGDSHIGTEHLLLALLQDDEGTAHEILVKLGFSNDALREETLKLRAARQET